MTVYLTATGPLLVRYLSASSPMQSSLVLRSIFAQSSLILRSKFARSSLKVRSFFDQSSLVFRYPFVIHSLFIRCLFAQCWRWCWSPAMGAADDWKRVDDGAEGEILHSLLAVWKKGVHLQNCNDIVASCQCDMCQCVMNKSLTRRAGDTSTKKHFYELQRRAARPQFWLGQCWQERGTR